MPIEKHQYIPTFSCLNFIKRDKIEVFCVLQCFIFVYDTNKYLWKTYSGKSFIMQIFVVVTSKYLSFSSTKTTIAIIGSSYAEYSHILLCYCSCIFVKLDPIMGCKLPQFHHYRDSPQTTFLLMRPLVILLRLVLWDFCGRKMEHMIKQKIIYQGGIHT